MATERLYRTDSYGTHFTAKVLSLEPAGEGTWLLLDRSLFYPTAGGQPHDTGVLAGQPVTDVKDDAGEVWHLLGGTPPEPGATVEGEIDWARRYRHMQRHTGQHLLSQAFLRVNPVFTTQAVSLSSPLCTLDIAGDPKETDLEQAEQVAAEAVYAAYPITAFEVPDSELDHYPLRRPPKVSGFVRLVRIGDWELSACGGTHLRVSAEAAPIKVLRSERVRGGLTRVTFSCGYDALEDYSLKHRIGYGLAIRFSSSVNELPDRVLALQDELSQMTRELLSLQERLAAVLAARLLAAAASGPQGRVVAHVLPPEDAPLLKPLAQALTREGDMLALLGTVQEGRARLLFARGEAVAADMNRLLQGALAHVAGKGGGRSNLAQGGGPEASGLAAALEHARGELVALMTGDSNSNPSP